MKAIPRKKLEKGLKSSGCQVLRSEGHVTWVCSCGLGHKAAVPHHNEVSPGTLRNVLNALSCLPRNKF